MSVDTRFGGLWRHPDFLKLWAAQTVSLGGSLVSRVALPLVAILTLDASPGEVALLRMADVLPGILLGLFAGVWVDRLRRRPLMIWADVGRALLLVSIPLAALLGTLGMEQLWVVVFAAGLLTALFEVAYQAYLPTLVSREEIVEGNSKLEASGAAIEVASFGLGGWLVQVLTAPIAILVDAVSFVVSAIFLWAIRTPEPSARETEDDRTTWLAISAGLGVVVHDPILRALGGAHATVQFFIAIWATMLLLFLSRDLGLEPTVFGILFAVGGVCSLIGATQAERVARRLGLGPTLLLTLFLSSLGILAVPLAAGPFVLVILLVVAQQLTDAPATIYQIHERSLIQTRAPEHSLGRVLASLRVVGWTAMLAGTLVGGVLGETLGPRTTMLIGAAGALPAVLWLVWSPVRRLRPHAPPLRRGEGEVNPGMMNLTPRARGSTMAISGRPDTTDDFTPSPYVGQRMTLEELLALPEEKPALEYVNGVVRQKVAAKPVQGSLQIYLGMIFNQIAWPLELGMAFTDTCFLTPDGPLVPDVVFYRSGRNDAPENDVPLPEDFTEPPDIAVEIRSPGQSVTEQIETCTRYLRLGVQITLFVHPEERAVMVFRLGQPLLVLRGDDRIDLGELLPGLDLTVQSLFQKSAPSWFRRRGASPQSQSSDKET